MFFSVIAIDLHRTGDTETNEHLLLASSSDVIFQFNDVDVVEQVHDVIKSTPLECSETPVASESITRNPASYRVTCTYRNRSCKRPCSCKRPGVSFDVKSLNAPPPFYVHKHGQFLCKQYGKIWTERKPTRIS